MSSIEFNENLNVSQMELKETNNINIEEQLDNKLNFCIKELNINNDNEKVINELKKYIIEPDMIMELINEEDIFNLFIEKFKKKYL
jgi:hypothetical protein